MRDPNRIEPLLNEIRELWYNVPDWRFGQLVVNVLGRDPFYIEDDEILEKFKELNKKK